MILIQIHLYRIEEYHVAFSVGSRIDFLMSTHLTSCPVVLVSLKHACLFHSCMALFTSFLEVPMSSMCFDNSFWNHLQPNDAECAFHRGSGSTWTVKYGKHMGVWRFHVNSLFRTAQELGPHFLKGKSTRKPHVEAWIGEKMVALQIFPAKFCFPTKSWCEYPIHILFYHHFPAYLEVSWNSCTSKSCISMGFSEFSLIKPTILGYP